MIFKPKIVVSRVKDFSPHILAILGGVCPPLSITDDPKTSFMDDPKRIAGMRVAGVGQEEKF